MRTTYPFTLSRVREKTAGVHSTQGDPGTMLASDEISMTHICSFLWKLHNEEDRKNRYMNECCQDICVRTGMELYYITQISPMKKNTKVK